MNESLVSVLMLFSGWRCLPFPSSPDISTCLN